MRKHGSKACKERVTLPVKFACKPELGLARVTFKHKGNPPSL